jgi:serine/threonine protein kinase
VGARVADSVLTALEYLNKERKQIHRDVKPSNVLVNSKGIIGEKKRKKDTQRRQSLICSREFLGIIGEGGGGRGGVGGRETEVHVHRDPPNVTKKRET